MQTLDTWLPGVREAEPMAPKEIAGHVLCTETWLPGVREAEPVAPKETAGYIPYTVADMNRASEAAKFTVISTFAGAGGSSTGYKLAGGKVLVSNEFVEHAYESYRLNHPTTHIFTGDIKTLQDSDFLKAAGLQPGELDIFDGSPPCTHFSMSGKRKKSWDQEKLYHGYVQVQIERLTEEMIRIAKGLQPRCIVIENVKALSAGRAHDYLSAFMGALNAIGYRCAYKILNASYYGVPQNRQRTFIICIREDIAKVLGLEELHFHQRVYPAPFAKQTTLRDGLANMKHVEGFAALRLKELADVVDGNPVVREVLKAIPYNPKKQMQFCKFLITVARTHSTIPELAKFKNRMSYFNYFRCAWNAPAPTITGRCHSYFLPDEDRCFTRPELMRIMSLPDDYKFAPGTEEDTEERIGLMVAPLQMYAIANHLYKAILQPAKEWGL